MKYAQLLMLCCVLAAVLLTSCSDDKATGSTPIKAGDPNDPAFLQVQSQIFSINDAALANFGFAYQRFSSLGLGAAAAPAGLSYAGKVALDSLDYHLSSGYWYYVSRDTLILAEGQVFYLTIDSVQFLMGSHPEQYPDPQLVTTVKIGARVLIRNLTRGDSLATGARVALVGDSGQLAAGGDAVLDGSGYARGYVTNITDSSNLAVQFNLATTYDSVALNLTDVFLADPHGCPTGGSISHAGSLAVTYQGPADTVSASGQWAARLTFSGSDISYSFRNGSTRWTGTTTCNGLNQGVAAYMRPFAEIVRGAE